MKYEDIVTNEGIDADFMSWLWDVDREAYCLILLGHLELINDELIERYNKTHEETYGLY